jgi:hypothetical protein
MLKNSDPIKRNARRNARLYFAGVAASTIGDTAMSLVAGIWVKALTGNNGAAELVSALVYVPSLAAPAAGMLADRILTQRRTPDGLQGRTAAALGLPLFAAPALAGLLAAGALARTRPT